MRRRDRRADAVRSRTYSTYWRLNRKRIEGRSSSFDLSVMCRSTVHRALDAVGIERFGGRGVARCSVAKFRSSDRSKSQILRISCEQATQSVFTQRSKVSEAKGLLTSRGGRRHRLGTCNLLLEEGPFCRDVLALNRATDAGLPRTCLPYRQARGKFRRGCRCERLTPSR